jgi:hypothetical protein
LKIKVTKWGSPKKYLKTMRVTFGSVFTNSHSKTMTIKMVIISFLICLKNRVFFNFKTTQQSKRY